VPSRLLSGPVVAVMPEHLRPAARQSSRQCAFCTEGLIVASDMCPTRAGSVAISTGWVQARSRVPDDVHNQRQ
jgi:hypothetical protein